MSGNPLNEFNKYKDIMYTLAFECSIPEAATPEKINYVINTITALEELYCKYCEHEKFVEKIEKFIVYSVTELYHIAMLSNLENIPKFHHKSFCDLGVWISGSDIYEKVNDVLTSYKITEAEESKNQNYLSFIINDLFRELVFI